jgi:hypothetical protein
MAPQSAGEAISQAMTPARRGIQTTIEWLSASQIVAKPKVEIELSGV